MQQHPSRLHDPTALFGHRCYLRRLPGCLSPIPQYPALPAPLSLNRVRPARCRMLIDYAANSPPCSALAWSRFRHACS